ncbi:hypothetical protein EV646_101174 [Kribbella antiqua]|uniref:Multiple sugar transport system permease protein n=1 Tax=Kribbella antiqua TaxID=2512217 RepID=A0A4R2IYZ6_9ACTN|nr:carbohydrate ABC transporter permease [Kribbella antiqua]TCO51191.1 hypothetical protein EV646_101174 [Kribbella antiqua]
MLPYSSAGLAWLYPLFWALGSSLKSDDEFFGRGLNPLPSHFLWANYLDAWREASFGRSFMNTILITVGTVVITLVVTSSAGYVLARTRFPGRGFCLGPVSATLFLPHGSPATQLSRRCSSTSPAPVSGWVR